MSTLDLRRLRASAVAAALAAAVTLAGLSTLGPLTPRARADVTAQGGDYVALPGPRRLADSRTATGGTSSQPLAPKATLSLPVLGRAGVPAEGVSAVMVSITAVSPTASGDLQAYAAGEAPGDPSVLVFSSATPVVSNSAVVAVTSAGITVKNRSAGTVHVVVDVQGYYTRGPSQAGTPGGFVPLGYTRVLDTRSGLGAPAGQVPGTGSVTLDFGTWLPAGVTSAYVDLTVIGAGTGCLSASAGGVAQPSRPCTMSFTPGRVSSGLSVPVFSGGKVTFSVDSTAPVDLVVTLEGFTAASSSSGGGFRVSRARLTPTPLVIAANGSAVLQVGGRNGLPLSGVAGAALNLTVASGTSAGSLTVSPVGEAASTEELVSHGTGPRSSLVVARPGTDGFVTVKNVSPARVSLVVDQYGWYDAQTTRITPRQFSATSVIQLPQRPSALSPSSLVYSWVSNEGELRIAYQDDPSDFFSLRYLLGGGSPDGEPLSGPTSLAVRQTPDDTPLQVSVQNGDTDVFVKNGPAVGYLGARWVRTAFADLGGSMASAPVIGTTPGGDLVVFAVSRDGSLWAYDEASTTAAWTRLPGASDLVGTPAVLTTDLGIRVAVTTTGGSVATALYGTSGLSPWVDLGATGVTDPPSLVAKPGSLCRVVARSLTKVITKAQVSATAFDADWVGPRRAPGPGAAGTPAVVVDPTTGRDVLVARDRAPQAQAQLWMSTETRQGSGVFGGWALLANTAGAATDPTATVYSPALDRLSYLITYRDGTDLPKFLHL